MNTSYASSCQATFILYLTNSPKTLQIGNIPVLLRPSEAKLSVLVTCPWRQNLEFHTNGGVPTTTPTWLAARRHKFATTVEFKLSNYLTSTPIVRGIPFFEAMGSSSWRVFAENQACGNLSRDRPFDSNGALPPRQLPSDFDLEQTAGFYYSTADLRTGIFFLGWAISDSKYLTEVRAMPDARNLRFADMVVSAPFDVQMLIQDYGIYDPTLELLFLNDVPAPAVTAASTPTEIQAAKNEVSNVAMIATIVCVVVVVCVVGAVGAVLFYRRSRDANNAKDLQRKLDAHTREESRMRTERTESTPASPREAGWKNADLRRSSVVNTFEN
eukprot:TRINITY_DN1449_c0_g1_i1.p1 TRINITY_DN1449_c0_g1~~TRINITY_DN1449_c0_g1_i1.p1  ORF type:complete len:328 (+),score=49.31 TRINITY_DN1449_c0_g1_i1:706-1689(+)